MSIVNGATTYGACGLRLESDFEIRELPTVAEGHCHFSIRCHPRAPVEVVNGQSSPLVANKNGRISFTWKGVGKYSVSRDGIVGVYPVEDVPRDMLRLPLLGVVLSAMLSWRGYRVLHASAVSISGRAVAFVGGKQHGKSTVAASMYARGHSVVTDDVFAIASTEAGALVTYPGPAGLKLWPNAIEALGFDNRDLYPLYDGCTKQILPVSPLPWDRAIPLGPIYLLQRGSDVEIQRMAPRDALIALMRHSFLYRYRSDEEHAATQLLHEFAEIVNAVPVRILRRPAELGRLEEVARLVEEDAASAPRSVV